MDDDEAHEIAIRWAREVAKLLIRALESGSPTRITLHVKVGDDLKVEEVRNISVK